MSAFAPTGEVDCPFEDVAVIEFYDADQQEGWAVCAYKTAECGGGREFTHGTFVMRDPDGAWPPVFLWTESISYRAIGRSVANEVVAVIDRVTPESVFERPPAPPPPEPEPPPPEDAPAWTPPRIGGG